MEMNINYRCADCQHVFSINVTEDEMETVLNYAHSEKCPSCGQKAGWGYVTCRHCGEKIVVELLHWHIAKEEARCESEWLYLPDPHVSKLGFYQLVYGVWGNANLGQSTCAVSEHSLIGVSNRHAV
jgi:DNA-directed RNA polymerase subunit RPC12/RpoP